MYNEKIQCYSFAEFLLAIYEEITEDDNEEINAEYAHCDIWLNGKSIQLHICDGED